MIGSFGIQVFTETFTQGEMDPFLEAQVSRIPSFL